MGAKPNAFRKLEPRSQPAAVPEGHSTIAQRFSVGVPRTMKSSPEGTAERRSVRRPVSRPFGTCSWVRLNPTLKRWAIVGLSLRDKEQGKRLMRSQFVTASAEPPAADASKRNIRHRPYAFTEHGAITAANVLKVNRKGVGYGC